MLLGGMKNIRVFLRPGYTDMRKAINGLSLIVEDELSLDLFTGNFFVFCNRKQRILKILYWDKTGFCLWQKRLEEDKFKWPKNIQQCTEISDEELSWLLRGLDFRLAHKTKEYKSIS